MFPHFYYDDFFFLSLFDLYDDRTTQKFSTDLFVFNGTDLFVFNRSNTCKKIHVIKLLIRFIYL